MFKKCDNKCTYERIVKDDEKLVQPKVYFTNTVLNQFKAYVDICDKEIGWLAFVKNEGDKYIVYDTILPKQNVTATTTDLNEESLNDIAFELMQTRPEDFDKVKCWCHSHVNMETFASGTDDSTFEQFYKQCDYFIRVICNKKDSMKVDFVDTINEIRFDNIDWEIMNDDIELARYTARLAEIEDEYTKVSNELEKIQEEKYQKVKANIKPIVDKNVQNKTYSYYKSYTPSYKAYNYEDDWYGYGGYSDWYDKKEKEEKKEEEKIIIDNGYYELLRKFWNGLSPVEKTYCVSSIIDLAVEFTDEEGQLDCIYLETILEPDELIAVMDCKNEAELDNLMITLGFNLNVEELNELMQNIYDNMEIVQECYEEEKDGHRLQ